jgi:hypothetical protein
VLDPELREQRAQTLGTLGNRVEHALAALRAYDTKAHDSDWKAQRGALLGEAADFVRAFMV